MGEINGLTLACEQSIRREVDAFLKSIQDRDIHSRTRIEVNDNMIFMEASVTDSWGPITKNVYVDTDGTAYKLEDILACAKIDISFHYNEATNNEMVKRAIQEFSLSKDKITEILLQTQRRANDKRF